METKHALALPFESGIIYGNLYDTWSPLLGATRSVGVVEVTNCPDDLDRNLARAVLLAAVADGRCKVAPELAARLERGATVLR